ncbi:MAG: hypothetical protein PHV11_08310 [Candidatus Bipolaricaulis sp.]|nr:hypothetical protein [Candidatus Bipolaricaulis sp.]
MKLFAATLVFIGILWILMVARQDAPVPEPKVVYRTRTIHVPVSIPDDSSDSSDSSDALERIATIEEQRELRRAYRKAFGKDPIW